MYPIGEELKWKDGTDLVHGNGMIMRGKAFEEEKDREYVVVLDRN